MLIADHYYVWSARLCAENSDDYHQQNKPFQLFLQPKTNPPAATLIK